MPWLSLLSLIDVRFMKTASGCALINGWRSNPVPPDEARFPNALYPGPTREIIPAAEETFMKSRLFILIQIKKPFSILLYSDKQEAKNLLYLLDSKPKACLFSVKTIVKINTFVVVLFADSCYLEQAAQFRLQKVVLLEISMPFESLFGCAAWL